ncbi:MAG: hypothetical protein C0602_05495 [Denitrovibrio sp.]|nr:MAG: hypothetical protein C0602_05495 [Denitrovibrio sp.]
MKALLIQFIFKLYISTFRYSVIVDDNVIKLADEGKRLVFFCWHNQLAITFGQSKRFKFVSMISRSKDGDLLAPLVESFGHAVVRASSSKGASAGLMEMVEYMDKGYHAAMAVDGPKGPVYKAKPGTLYLAKKADRILVPVLGNCTRFFRFKSWDRFILPKPFAKVNLHLCAPITISSSLEKEDVEQELSEVENKIMELTRVHSENII